MPAATNAHILVKLPIEELFPAETVAKDEELYFEADMWASSKMDKAERIEREGLLFKVFDKRQKLVGIITALDKPTFEKSIGQYPDVDVVLPDEKLSPVAVPSIAFNHALLSSVCAAFGQGVEGFDYTFYGRDKCIKITHQESKGIGIVMPFYRSAQ